MAVLTPHLFNAAVDDVWAKAQADFARSHFVYGHLIGVSRDVTMCNIAQAGTEEEHAAMRGRGITSIPPGAWRKHESLIATTLAANNSVAAIWLGEAWTTSGQAGIETMVRGTRPSDHPLRDEMVYVYATWPRARLHRFHFARINRGKLGGQTPVLEDVPDDHPLATPPPNERTSNPTHSQTGKQTSNQTGNPAAVLMFGWIDDLLPQPPSA